MLTEKTRRSLLWVVIGIVTVLSCGTVLGDDVKEQKDFEKTTDQILELGTTINLSNEEKIGRLRQLEAMGQEIEKNWADKDAERYGRLMFKLSTEIGGMDAREKSQDYVAQRLALQALEKADKMPLSVHCDLLDIVCKNVGPDGKPLKGDAWAALRKRLATLQLVGWQRIEQTIDENWDPDEVLHGGNIEPPEGVSGAAGMDPEGIADSKLRAQYIAAIEANNKKLARHGLQSNARDLRRSWIPYTERFLIEAYIKAPDGLEELEALLNTYVSDKAKRARILNAVKKKEMPDDLVIKNTTQPAR